MVQTYLCKICGQYKSGSEMVRNQKTKSGYSNICKNPCKKNQNRVMHLGAKARHSGNYKDNYHPSNCNHRDEHEMERPDKTPIVVGYLKELMKSCGYGITYLQLGLDFPDCTIGGIPQVNAEREMVAVLKTKIKNKPMAIEIDQTVIDDWDINCPNMVDIRKMDWKFSAEIKEPIDFIYSNDFGNDKGKTVLEPCKKLNPKVFIKLVALRNGDLKSFILDLKKLFNNYTIYSYTLGAKNRGNMRMIVLIRKDMNINLPILEHRIYEE